MEKTETFKKRSSQERIIDAVILLSFVLSLAILIFQYFSPGLKAISPPVSSYRILQPQSVKEEVIPDFAGVRRTYQFDMTKVPGGSGRGRTFFVYLRHTNAVLETDGNIIADTGVNQNMPHIGLTPGNYWLSLPIYGDYDKKTIDLTLTPVYGSVRNEQPVFLLIDREPLLNLMVLPKEMPLITMSLFAITVGVFLMIIALAIGLNPPDREKLFFLGAVSTAGGLWKQCGFSAVPLLLDFQGWQKLIWYTGACSYLLMMIFSLRLLVSLRAEKTNRIGIVCCWFSASAAILFLILQAAGLVELHEILVWYGLGMASLHLIALLGQKPSRDEILWLFPTFLSLAVDLLLFLKNGSMTTAPVFLSWIILNLFVRGFGFLRMVIRRERELRIKDEELRGVKMQTMINQIRPHFIFNTLASVNMLCEENPKRAMEIISDFSQYLQANFSALATIEPVPFSEEMKHVKAYLDVESALYEEKLTVAYDTEYTAFRLSPLTLQPVVENCIKHGFRENASSLHIIIRTHRTADGVEIRIEDNGRGYDPSHDGALHIGLQNVKERLNMMCGGTLQLIPNSSGTSVIIFIPDSV